jgi:hypothetical protein
MANMISIGFVSISCLHLCSCFWRRFILSLDIVINQSFSFILILLMWSKTCSADLLLS